MCARIYVGTGGNVCASRPPHEAETSSFPRTCPIGYSPQNGIWVPRNLGLTVFFAVEDIRDSEVSTLLYERTPQFVDCRGVRNKRLFIAERVNYVCKSIGAKVRVNQ